MSRNVCEKFRSLLYSILSLFLLVSLASCYPEFKNPIPPPPELKADHQILGTWVITTKSGSKQQLSIFQRGSGWIDVVYIYDIHSDVSMDGINVLIFEGYSTSVNKEKFLCLRFRKKDFSWRLQEKDYSRSDKEVGEFPFLIVNYETPSNDELIIKHFSTQKVEELIKKGKLKGEVVKEDIFKGQPFDKVTVSSSSDELVDVISKEGAGAFIWQDANDTFRDMYILVFSRIKP
jgi:hypothetical protein